jgi:Sulfotransferase family
MTDLISISRRFCAPLLAKKTVMYALVHIEKTAGTTLTAILRRSFGTGHCDIRLPLAKRGAPRDDLRPPIDALDLRRVQRIYRQLTGISGHDVKAYSNLHLAYPQLRFFTFVRDPSKRYISHFLTRCANMPDDLDRWLDAGWTHNWQTKMIAGQPSAEKAIEMIDKRFGFVGLTERFDESLLMFGQWLNEPAFRTDYRPLNQRSENRGYRDTARNDIGLDFINTAEFCARIEHVNSEDQKVYDYVASVVFARQRAAYRGDLEVDGREFQAWNNQIVPFAESKSSRFLRNYVYKPLLHCRAA